MVQSPSFNLIKKSDKPLEKTKATRNLLDDSLNLFRELPEMAEDVDDMQMSPKKEEDPFDKLVESPCFNLVKKSEKQQEKTKAVKNLLDDSLNLFRELPETEDDYSRDMELSDCESQTQIFTRSTDLFSDAFSKSPTDMEFSGKLEEGKAKDSDDEDTIRAQIQRAIAGSSSTDNDSRDALTITPTANSYQAKRREVDPAPLATILGKLTVTKNIFPIGF